MFWPHRRTLRVFNALVPAMFGAIVASELAISTDAPILTPPTVKASALPKVYDAYTLACTQILRTILSRQRIMFPICLQPLGSRHGGSVCMFWGYLTSD